jgi:hypothetical protein
MTELDRIVDDVAAGMTAAPPPPHLRARVLARLEAPTHRAWTWKLAPIAALAAIVTIAVMARRPEPQTSGPDRSIASSAPLGPAALPPAEQVSAPILTVKPAPRPSGRIHQPTAAELAWRERAIPALGVIDPIALADIQPTPLTIPQLEVKPLTAAPNDGGSRER